MTLDVQGILADGVSAAVGPVAAAYAIAAVGLNLHIGHTGLWNFGQVGFMLAGAYGLAITMTVFGGPLWLGVSIGVAAAFVLALVAGVPALRMPPHHLAITTIAGAEFLRAVVVTAGPLTGGPTGLPVATGMLADANPFPAGEYHLLFVSLGSEQRLWLLAVAWAVVLSASLLVRALARSPWGRVARSVRGNEDIARAVGKRTDACKLQSFMAGGVIGALAGMVLVVAEQRAHPAAFLPVVTLFVLTALTLGGVGSTWGPVLGSVGLWFVVGSFDAMLEQVVAAGVLNLGPLTPLSLQTTFVALLLGLLVMFRPRGIAGDPDGVPSAG